jgi:hypothetical protein
MCIFTKVKWHRKNKKLTYSPAKFSAYAFEKADAEKIYGSAVAYDFALTRH